MRRVGRLGRLSATIVLVLVTEVTACALAVMPVFLLWQQAMHRLDSGLLRTAVLSILTAPSYLLFALGLMFWSAVGCRLTRARTPEGVSLRIADMSWPLMTWARYVVSIHVVSLFAGSVFRGSPVWTWYLRLNGARLGRRVYVNSVFISDHNLLSFGHDVVIGSDVHLSGHTVEGGRLVTARVTLGRGVTIGLGTAVQIDVEIGDGCTVGAMSYVPKHARLAGGRTYVGVPVRERDASSRVAPTV